MDDDERQATMKPWREEFHFLVDKYDLDPSCVYNADQTGLYYQKLPNWMYVNAKKKKSYAGVKQMKDKTQIIVMVCTAASNYKCPLAVVGKSKRPQCFSLSPNGIPPIAYTHQSNAWFDKGVTLWWLNNVFWPWHVENHGEVYCLLLLDNCSAHCVLKEQYS